MPGGSSSVPPRAKYTECERAVLFIMAREVERQGICDLSGGQIAAEGRRVHKGSAERGGRGGASGSSLAVKSAPAGPQAPHERPAIMSIGWLTWIKRGPIGYKDYTATKIIVV